MPAGDIPQRERPVFYTYLVECQAANLSKLFLPKSTSKKKKNSRAKKPAKDAATAPKAAKPSQNVSKGFKAPPKASKIVLKKALKVPVKKTMKPVAKKTKQPAVKKATKPVAKKTKQPAVKKATKPVAKKAAQPSVKKTTATKLASLPKKSPAKVASKVKPTPVKQKKTPISEVIKPTGPRIVQTKDFPLPAFGQAPTGSFVEQRRTESSSSEAVPPRPSTPKITIVTLGGMRKEIPIDPATTTVAGLKQKILNDIGIPVDQQRLISNGCGLEPDEALLRSLGVHDGAQVFLILRLK